MQDPIVGAARQLLDDGFDTLRRVIDGLDATALNWIPAGDETNSIAVLATHAMGATRVLLKVAVTGQEPTRDRAAEFTATADDAASLIRLVDDLGAECMTILDGAGPIDWSVIRRRKRSTGEIVEMTAAYVLMHAVTHLRCHADEASLTRHLWMART